MGFRPCREDWKPALETLTLRRISLLFLTNDIGLNWCSTQHRRINVEPSTVINMMYCQRPVAPPHTSLSFTSLDSTQHDLTSLDSTSYTALRIGIHRVLLSSIHKKHDFNRKLFPISFTNLLSDWDSTSIYVTSLYSATLARFSTRLILLAQSDALHWFGNPLNIYLE